jgi:predicted enzyme related to lactoylglutathione lyase
MHSTIHNITFDCADARAQAMFWAVVTGGTAQERDATPGHVEYVVLPLSDGTPRLYFQTVDEQKRVKNRVHLDVSPESDDKQAELARLVGLGASVAADQPPDVGWIVMADPEGNEFCLD